MTDSTAPAGRRLSGFPRLAIATTVTTLVLVFLGGLVRATDNGLSCGSEWPYCYGLLFPLPGDLPGGVSFLGAWAEHGHRLLASIVGVLVLTLVVWALARHRTAPGLLWPAVAALVLVTIQAWIGRQVVLGLLAAHLVTLHLGMAMMLVACLVYLTVNSVLPRRAAARAADAPFVRLSAAVAALTFVQLLVGATLTGVGGGVIWTDFPLMGGALFPPVESEAAALHVTHRYLAYVLTGVVVWLYVAARRRWADAEGTQRWLLRLPALALGLTLVQVLLGVANLVWLLNPLSVVPHLAVASWLWAVLFLHMVLARRLGAPAIDDRPTPAQGAVSARAAA